MNICVSCKDYFKESKEVQKTIVIGAETLYGRIQNYEKQNIDFNRIFNDDKVKYDKHGQFYAFKVQKSNMQLRVLCSHLTIDCVPVLVIADSFVKKRNSKDYIDKFDSVNEGELEDVLQMILHKMHHAFVHYTVENIGYESELAQDNYCYKQAREWKENTENYISSGSSYDEYSNQPIEVDARAYAEKRVEYYLKYIEDNSSEN